MKRYNILRIIRREYIWFTTKAGRLAMEDLEKKSIERIKTASEMSLFHYKKPLICTYSGGKDSDVMLELFKRSGIPFEVHNSHTTADAPQTVYHIRETFRELELQGIKCSIDYHKKPDGSRLTMWNLIPKKLMPPTRITRYCCTELKESSCKNRMIATGIRWDESRKRKERQHYEVIGSTKKTAVRVEEKMLLSDNEDTRRLFEKCEMRAETVVNPIIDWKDDDIWDFYWNECKNHNPLYRMGYFRVGCIGCPMANKARHTEFRIFPKYKEAYMRAFEKMLTERKRRELTTEWNCAQDVYDWWMEDKNVPGQISLFDERNKYGD